MEKNEKHGSETVRDGGESEKDRKESSLTQEKAQRYSQYKKKQMSKYVCACSASYLFIALE